jgi:flagellar hook protein FlgE
MIASLFTSSSALAASQLMLSVVGNNLANSNTTGYKSQSIRFADQFSQLLRGPSESTSVNGGKNPIQLGLGVQVAATDTNLSQGTFATTGNSLDLAIQDAGYFVLKNGDNTVFTRDGAFSVDASNHLVNAATGAKVQRVGTVGEGTPTAAAFQIPGNSNITIPKGLTIPGVATQNISFTGNLNASSVGPLAQVLKAGQSLTAGGIRATGATLLNSLDQTTTQYVAGDQISISGTRVDGAAVTGTYTFSGTASDTVNSLLATINQAFLSGTSGTGATAAIDSTGHITLTANKAGPATLSMSMSSATGSAGVTNFTNFLQTTAGKNGDTNTTVIQVFDGQSTPHNITFGFEKVSANRWNVTASMDPKEGTITGFGEDNSVAGLSFNQDGSFLSVVGTSDAESQVTSNPFTSVGGPATASTLLDSLDQHTGGPYAAGDSIKITGIDFAGNTVSTSLPTVDPVTSAPATVGDLVNAINTSFGGAVATIDASGNIQFTAKKAGQTALSVKLTDSASNTGGKSTFSNFFETTRGTAGDENIAFNVSGLAGYGKAQTIRLGFGTPNGFDGVSQFGGPSSTASRQDGYAQGTLVSESVSSNGVITGQFSNGKTEALAQVALATFANPEGLAHNGNNFLSATTNSGLATITSAGAGGAGTIQSSALESSNVDVGSEFTQLIAAQRGFQVNAKAFSAANQMMQDTVDLLR